MGQVSRRLVVWSTGERLRWMEEKEYKGERIPLQRGGTIRKSERTYNQELKYLYKSQRYLYKNISSSDLIVECFSF